MFHMKQLDQRILKIFEKYTEILLKWNEKINLTSYEKEELFQEALFDCIAISVLLNHLKINSFADMGSGNGIPGLIVKMINNQMDAHLIDSSQKKVAFLEYVSRILDINVSVYHTRLPDKKFNHRFGCVISKASMQENKLLKISKEILIPKGWLIYFAGESDLMEDKEMALKGVICYKRPDNSTSRLIIRKKTCW